MATEASGPVPDQGVQHGGGEHQHQRWCPQQRQYGADAEVHAVLEQQPATGKAAATGFLPERDQGMAEIARE